MVHPLHTASSNPIPGPDPSGSGEQRDWGPQPAYARSPLPPPAAHGQLTAPTGGAGLPAPVPPPASATAPLSIATPTTLTGPAATTTRRGEPSAFGIAAGLAALVLVGGISFAAGRWSVDEDAGVAGGGGGLAIGAAGAQAQGPGTRAEAQAQGPGARADRSTNGSRDAAGVADDTFGGSTADIGTDDAAPAAAGANAGAGAGADGVQEPDDAGGPEGGPPAGARGGLAPGNIEGTVASLSSDSIGILDLTGATVELEIDDTTELVIEMFDEVASLAPGELVQVALAQPVAAGDTANESFEAGLAGTVTVLPPGSELGGEPRGGFAAGERPGADAERDGAAGGARQGARRGGSRRAALQGEIITVDASGLTLELPSGETRSVTLDPATEVRRQADAAFAELGIDQRVRATVARGGFGQDADQGTSGLTTAARIVLLDAVATP